MSTRLEGVRTPKTAWRPVLGHPGAKEKPSGVSGGLGFQRVRALGRLFLMPETVFDHVYRLNLFRVETFVISVFGYRTFAGFCETLHAV
jgi:hypothetical protein